MALGAVVVVEAAERSKAVPSRVKNNSSRLKNRLQFGSFTHATSTTVTSKLRSPRMAAGAESKIPLTEFPHLEALGPAGLGHHHR